MDKIWKLAAKQKQGEPLPVIIPLILYHGKEEWAVSEKFSDMFGDVAEEVRRFIPEFSYTLYDLSRYSDDDLKSVAGLNVAMLLFKHIFNDKFTEKFEEIVSLFKELDDTDSGLEYFRIVLRYILNAAEGVSIKELKTIIDENLSRERGGDVMTIAEQLRQEGIQKGIQKGIQEGRQEEVRECVIEVLDTRFGFVHEDIKDKIEGVSDIKFLERLHKDAIIVSDLNEFFRILSETDTNKH